MTEFQLDHPAFCRIAIGTGRGANKRMGLDLVRWFFRGCGAHRTHWTSKEMARQINKPVSVVNTSLRLAKRAQLVELTPKGWRWAEF